MNNLGQKYDISTIAELTGVNPITLRAWEKRYSLVVPQRSENGRRVYSNEDLERIIIILAWLKQGIPLRKVKDLLKTDPESMSHSTSENNFSWNTYKRKMHQAIDLFDYQALDDVYNELTSIYPFYLILKNVIKPIFTELGAVWEKQHLGEANEHFFSTYFRNKIGARILYLSAQQKKEHTLLLACLPGEHHELGLLCFALHAMENGFNCITLGQNLPLHELAGVMTKIKPALSILYGCINSEITSICKEIVKKNKVRIAFVERNCQTQVNFTSKGLYELSKDFDFTINAIRKIIIYSK